MPTVQCRVSVKKCFSKCMLLEIEIGKSPKWLSSLRIWMTKSTLKRTSLLKETDEFVSLTLLHIINLKITRWIYVEDTTSLDEHYLIPSKKKSYGIWYRYLHQSRGVDGSIKLNKANKVCTRLIRLYKGQFQTLDNL